MSVPTNIFLYCSLLIAGVFSLQCYSGISTVSDKHPTFNMTCAKVSEFCLKVSGSVKYNGKTLYQASYGCDVGTCLSPGCTDLGSVKTCCCGTDLCNSSFRGGFSLIMLIVSIVFICQH
ncbi:ET module [Ancylostoma caninum]|uniref:ET module n=1 Tax=Ancylostoma caninum TaxID=29170 RepID=A0A368GUC7_ANCCA|nr:ET module [Ancylostoma caninum]